MDTNKRSPPQILRTYSNTPHYQTFPTKPPAGKGRPPFTGRTSHSSRHNSGVLRDYDNNDYEDNSDRDDNGNGDGNGGRKNPMTSTTKRQLIVLAVISLAEQTALNSISPYLPSMTASFPGVDPEKVGLNVGIIASCFAVAQVATNFFWGRLSDRIGRKPVILIGTFWTAVGFLAFGYAKTLWQAALIQALIGLVNGNAGVVSTVLGEITDKSDQATSFSYLPMVYGLGSILGPVMGGLLAGSPSLAFSEKYPYFLPNAVCSAILLVDFIISMIYLDESLSHAQELPPLGTRMRHLFAWLWQFTAGAVSPSYLRRKLRKRKSSALPHTHQNTSNQHHHHHNRPHIRSRKSSASLGSPPRLFPRSPSPSPESTAIEQELKATLLTTPVLFLLVTYFIFNLSNITFTALYPIYISTPPPTGYGLTPKEIGITISVAGLAAILFQACAGDLQAKWGAKSGFRIGMLGMAISFFLMPLTGNWNNDIKWLYVSISFVMLLKSISNVVGLTCTLIMFTNATPDPSVLGRINGVAQTLAAAGRAVGPFLSGGLWSLAMKREGGARTGWLAWGVFGGIALLGFLLTLGIRGGLFEGEEDEDEENGRGYGVDGSSVAEESSSSQAALGDGDDNGNEEQDGDDEVQRGRRGERERLLGGGGGDH